MGRRENPRTDEPRDRDGDDDGRTQPPEPRDPAAQPDPRAGLDREVGDLEDPDAEDAGALPGRAGGGLAGG